jgi:glycosyl transferase, family 25
MTYNSAPAPALPPDWPVLVINLDRRSDRLALMRERLSAQGLAFERITAVDARAPDFAERAAPFPRYGAIGQIGDGMLACNLSHACAWERIVASGAAAGVVLEDDALPSPGFAGFLGALAAARLGYDLVKLERYRNERGVFLHRRGAMVAGRQVARLRSLHAGGAAYVLSAAGARTALARFPRNTLPVDHFLFNPVAGSLFDTLRPRQVIPALVRQDDGPAGSSDTLGAGRTTQRDFRSRTRYHLRRGVNESAAFLAILPAILAGRVALRRVTVA